MKASRCAREMRSAPPTRRLHKRFVVTTAAFAVLAAAAGCSSSPSSSAPPTSAHTTKASAATPSTSAAPTTTVPPKTYLARSGKGDKSFVASGLPAKWMAAWRFDCEHPTRKANFVLEVGAASGSLVRITSQTGLGGGGQRPYTSGGSYRFSVSTSCNWDVTAEAMPTA